LSFLNYDKGQLRLTKPLNFNIIKEVNTMNPINRFFQILIAACFALPVSAYAETWSCSHNNNVREVQIERTTAEAVPCNVVYKKPTEGVEDQILWDAENDDSYCDEKAEEFVAKLESWGWVCTETISDGKTGSGY
jgi:hypothetical protein